MVEFTVAKSKVGPITERYMNGEYQSIEQKADDGVKRVAILGLDNSHNRDYKVAYASDPLITIRSHTSDVSFDQLENTLKEIGIWDVAQFTRIYIPSKDTEWVCGFKTTPDRADLISLIHEKCETQVEEHELLGNETEFAVYY